MTLIVFAVLGDSHLKSCYTHVENVCGKKQYVLWGDRNWHDKDALLGKFDSFQEAVESAKKINCPFEKR